MRAPDVVDVRPAWLWLTVPIVVLAVAASLIGILVDSVYAKETAEWAGQSVGQDIANLIVYPAMLLLAAAAARNSLKAYLAWLGTLVYSAYAYAIYAFDIHFGPLFLVYVAVLGLSSYALGGGLLSLDVQQVRASFAGLPSRLAAGVLVALAVVFCVLWLAIEIPASLTNAPPKELVETGLLTNPVHVLDLGLFLPALAMAGVLLWRQSALGYCLAPVLLTATAAIGVGIVSLTAVLAHHGEASLALGLIIGAVSIGELFVLMRFLRTSVDDRLAHVLKGSGE